VGEWVWVVLSMRESGLRMREMRESRWLRRRERMRESRCGLSLVLCSCTCMRAYFDDTSTRARTHKKPHAHTHAQNCTKLRTHAQNRTKPLCPTQARSVGRAGQSVLFWFQTGDFALRAGRCDLHFYDVCVWVYDYVL
jgi:hypothetical protein